MAPGMQPMQEPMTAPGMQQPMKEQPDAWTILSQMPACEVQEKARWGEALTGWIGAEIDFANKYKVLDPEGREVMLFVETTDCCTRQMKRFLCVDCVGWKVDGMTIFGGQQTPFLKMNRDWTCTCCCFNRPVTQITDAATGNLIGSIRDPFAFCDLTFGLMGPDGSEVLQAKGGCCQWGMHCPMPCGPCKEVHFDLVDAKTQSEVGHITKKVPSCLKCLVGDVDNYKVDFQKVQDTQWKAMLLALTLFIDFRYFNEAESPGQAGAMEMF